MDLVTGVICYTSSHAQLLLKHSKQKNNIIFFSGESSTQIQNQTKGVVYIITDAWICQ